MKKSHLDIYLDAIPELLRDRGPMSRDEITNALDGRAEIVHRNLILLGQSKRIERSGDRYSATG